MEWKIQWGVCLTGLAAGAILLLGGCMGSHGGGRGGGGCGGCGGGPSCGSSSPAHAPTSGPDTSAVAYTCSMHPQVRAAAPGHCPICGMALVEKK
ncbi:MAG: hypothetical protein HYY93_12195 [Planctomycetes bacterium]|nr:hypothetical protein [Planctomycetota bacterium]